MQTSETWQPCWKLTDEMGLTGRYHRQCQWAEDTENPHGVKRGNDILCSNAWYHAYDSPYVAMVFNCNHACFFHPILWEAEWRGKRKNDQGKKFGATELRTIRQHPFPTFTAAQKQAFAVACAAYVLDETPRTAAWHRWAAAWLNGEEEEEASSTDSVRSVLSLSPGQGDAMTAAQNAFTAVKHGGHNENTISGAANRAIDALCTCVRNAVYNRSRSRSTSALEDIIDVGGRELLESCFATALTFR